MYKKKNDNLSSGITTGKVIISLIFIGVIALWVLYPVWSYIYKGWFYNSKFIEIGIFGDSFGALNTLFSALAFIGIISSIFFQSQELELNREELKRTRAEFETQGKQFEQQTIALKKQVFENTFFQLVVMSNKVKDTILEGQGFKDAYEVFTSYEYKNKSGNTHLDDIGLYLKIHDDFDGAMGLYYRNIYQILKFIDENNNISPQDRKLYSNYLRAQLSQHELYFLFYNCLSELGNEKFKPYLERYEFLEHLSKTLRIQPSHLNQYNVSVFGTSNLYYLVCYFEALTAKWWSDFYKSGEKGMICVRARNGNLYKIDSRKEYAEIKRRIKEGEVIIADVVHNSFYVE